MLTNKPLKILILGLNYSPEIVGIAVYTSGFVEELIRRGHIVQVVAGKPYYPGWAVPGQFRGGWKRRTLEGGVDLTRVAHYVPSNPTGARRILHHMSFAASCAVPLLAKAIERRPDVVLTVAPSLIAAPVAWLIARLVDAKAWLHIQDFEVEAAMATGLVSGGRLGSKLARWFESFVLRRFDQVSSISPAMCRKCVEKGVQPERVVEFRNWADINAIRPLETSSPYREEWGVTTPHVALYSGNIANKQGIDIVIDVARRLKHRSDLTFVVCGDGPNRASLEARSTDLPNILFKPLQPKERLSDLLGLATLHLLPQLASAADLVLPSKLTNMLASGRPIAATAHLGTGLANEVQGCGVVVPPEDADALAKAIEGLLASPSACAGYGRAARQRAKDHWDQNAILDRLEAALLALTAKRQDAPDAGVVTHPPNSSP